MLATVMEILKNNQGKSISIGMLALIIMVWQGLVQFGDSRWSLAADTKQIQQQINDQQIDDLEDRLMVINMKRAGATQEQIDAALKEKYEARLNAIRQRQGQ